MMLVKGYTFEMQGRVADAIEHCDAAVEATRLSANPHDLAWALCELAFAQYHAGDLEAAIAAAEESARVGGRMTGDTIPAGGGGPGWVLGMSHFEAGDVERARGIMHSLGSDDLPHKIPVEKCFDWEVLALVELALGHEQAADDYVRRAEEHAALLGLRLPAALALRARAAILLAGDEPLAAARLASESAEVAAAAGARLPAAFSLALAGRALAAAGDRAEAIAVLRRAESELDACGSVRVRDELRRELRRLGVRVQPPAPSRLPRSGFADLLRELQRPARRGAAGGAGQGARRSRRSSSSARSPTARCRDRPTVGPSRPSSGTAARSRRSSTTPRWMTIPSSSTRSALPRRSPWRTSGSRSNPKPSSRSCRLRASGSSRQATPNGDGSSATCTTAPSSGSSRSPCNSA